MNPLTDTKPVRIQLKSPRSLHGLSQETLAYTAGLVVDGVHIGTVSNEGTGGCDRFTPMAKGIDFREAHRIYDDACLRVRDEFPKINIAEDGEPEDLIPDSLDMVCARLVIESDQLKRMRRMLRKQVLAYEAGRPAGPGAPLYQYRLDSPAALAGVAAAIRRKHPHAWILNEHPEDVAFEAFMMGA